MLNLSVGAVNPWVSGDWRFEYSWGISFDPPMPRMHDGILDTAVYLYRTEHEAHEGLNIGGSGFLLSVPCERVERGIFTYVVTNRHVIAARATVVRMNTAEGGKHIENLPIDGWIKSKTDDLAIHPVIIDFKKFKAMAIPLHAVLSKEAALSEYKIGIGDNVLMVGRFINHEGKQQNAPLVRFGAIAQMPYEPISYTLEGNLHEQESIIADIRSIGGFSGSPVLLNELGFLARAGAKQLEKHFLIGVDWGHIQMWSPVCGPDERPIGDAQVNINSGMAGIVPSWKLRDLIMSDDLVNDRKRREDIHLGMKKATAAVPDISVPPTDENPQHREDFTSLVDAAAQKQKPSG